MNGPESSPSRLPSGLLFVAPVVSAAVLALAGHLLSGSEDLRRAALAAAVSGLLGGLAGVLPVWMSLGSAPQQFVAGYMGGLMARFAVTGLAALAAYVLLGDLPRMAFGVWVGGAQLAILAVDTALLLLILRSRSR